VEKMLAYSSKSSRLVLALAALATSAAVTLSADSRGADPGKQAEEHYLRGKMLLKSGDVKGAYLEYKASFELKQSYDIAANLGNLELDQGMPRDAAEHLEYALRTVAVNVPEDRVKAIRGLLEQARRLVGAATVKVNIDGAEVLVDGRSVGRSPLPGEIFVDPGKRTIEARLSPYTPAQKSIDIARAASVPVELTLVLPSATATASAAPSGSAPPMTTSGPVKPKSMIPVGVGVATAAAGLGLGIVGLVLSGSKASRVDLLQSTLTEADVQGNHSVCASSNPPAECADLDSALVAKGSFRNLAIAGFATAGVAALATVTWVLLPGPKASAGVKKSSQVRASFGAAPSGGSVTLRGEF
jgi:acyl dehydratase